MRVLLDACVLYPTVLREILLGAAKAGLYQPLWSARILDEWLRAVARNLPDQAPVALGEIALLRANWPKAEVNFPEALQASLYLPDPDDRHVLAAAIAGQADTLVTANLRDFPTRLLASHNILRRDPDGFLLDLWQDDPRVISMVCAEVRSRAEELSGQPHPLRALLKKAGLPRLGKKLA
jgi:predicted nucleic acid-binding protein